MQRLDADEVLNELPVRSRGQLCDFAGDGRLSGRWQSMARAMVVVKVELTVRRRGPRLRSRSLDGGLQYRARNRSGGKPRAPDGRTV